MRLLAPVLILALAAPSARADDRDDARAEFAAGQAADQRREWQAAIEHYLRAYDLAPHPFALHNIGFDYEQLGQLREAVRFYERYLRDAPDPADRVRVERLVATLRARPSKLTVRSSPPGARVIIDGQPAGATPYTGVVPGGAHRVAVESDSDRQTRDIAAEFAEPLALSLELRGADGTLVVTGTPTGAAVLVDGSPAGQLPAALTVPSGTHRVQITSDGYQPYEATVEVEPNRPARLDADLRRAPPKKPPIGYSVGGLGGADARTRDPLFGAEVGLRNDRYQAVVQLGRLGDVTVGGLVLRWSTATRIAPFFGLGYVYFSDATSKLGYTAEAGLRADLNLTGPVRFAARLGASLASRDVDDPDMTGATKSLRIVPITLSLEVWFPRLPAR